MLCISLYYWPWMLADFFFSSGFLPPLFPQQFRSWNVVLVAFSFFSFGMGMLFTESKKSKAYTWISVVKKHIKHEIHGHSHISCYAERQLGRRNFFFVGIFISHKRQFSLFFVRSPYFRCLLSLFDVNTILWWKQLTGLSDNDISMLFFFARCCCPHAISTDVRRKINNVLVLWFLLSSLSPHQYVSFFPCREQKTVFCVCAVPSVVKILLNHNRTRNIMKNSAFFCRTVNWKQEKHASDHLRNENTHFFVAVIAKTHSKSSEIPKHNRSL